MTLFELRAIPQSPLHLSNRHSQGNHADSLGYIPGTAMRGALASVYLQREELQQEVVNRLDGTGHTFWDYFDWLFLSGAVRFPNLYPAPLVLPASARSCKISRGFDRGDQGGHGISDILLYEPVKFRCRKVVTTGARSYTCGAPMDSLPESFNFYNSPDGKADLGSREGPRRRILTRTAIENPTETVQQSLLYSLETLEQDFPRFLGTLQIGPPPDWEAKAAQAAQELLSEHLGQRVEDGRSSSPYLGALTEITVGAARSRGLGALQLDLEPGESTLASLGPLKDRLEQLQEVWQRIFPEKSEVTVFTLTLHSDAIVMDPLWRYVSVLSPEILDQEVSGAPECSLERSFTSTRVVSGWNTAQKLPREDEFAIVKGSAFFYTTTADPQTLLDWLAQIERRGIGERQTEGFGHVIACHPFHQEVPQS